MEIFQAEVMFRFLLAVFFGGGGVILNLDTQLCDNHETITQLKPERII